MRWQLACTGLAFLFSFVGGVQAQEMPERIGPEAVRQAKRATVYLKVTDAAGGVGEGSGFLAVEPGIVVTNAHVVGMLSPGSKPPRQIDVVLRSGEPDETTLNGKLLGVDRVNDLAVLKVEGKLPAPLRLGLKDELFETRKVYIFGFPFGAKLGRDITVSESSITSLRKDASGALERIQVNGGMHPGNSGGPVVNALGEVVGVSVAGIRSTEINFAIPAKRVQALLEGGIQEVKAGVLVRAKDEVKVPVNYLTLDPFNRIKEFRVEVWSGPPGMKRPFAADKALPQKGDGPRRSQTLKMSEGSAAGEVVLPVPGPGQVAWVQPVLVRAGGEQIWGLPLSLDPALAVERLDADFTVRLAAQKERTVHLKTTQSATLSQGKFRLAFSDSAKLDILEAFGPNPKGAHISLGFGPPTLTFEENGRKGIVPPEVVRLLRLVPPHFVVDQTNKVRERSDIKLNPMLPAVVREQVADFLSQISNAYEATNFILPNRKIRPAEEWQALVPILIKVGDKTEVTDLFLSLTYEGVRGSAGKSEALVSFTGKVHGRGPRRDKMAGEVSGKFTFDTAKAFISSVQMTISTEATAAEGDLKAHFAFNIDLTREEGNPNGIDLPRSGPATTPPVGEILLSRNGVLSPADPLDRVLGARGSRAHTIPIELEAGKKYSLLVTSSAFDTYLRLMDPTGRLVAEDDDGGGGLNSRINHVAGRTGQYQVVVTSFNGKAGPYQLQVFGERGKGVAKIDPPKLGKEDPKPALEGPVKGFERPARAAAPTSYLKVVSSPGDYIGQGKNYEYAGAQLVLKTTPRGVHVRVDGWTLEIGAPKGQFLEPGEYREAKRFAFSGASPGLNFAGKGRGSNRIAGEFVVWELEVAGGEITRIAIDFLQRSEEKGPPLTGKLRFNSNLE